MKTGTGYYDFRFNICGGCLKYNMIQDFSVWIRTGSNPVDIHRF